jgi:ornithine cyclodeaminase/alanine dehydrogenase-like protein (mu-crystallin family)
LLLDGDALRTVLEPAALVEAVEAGLAALDRGELTTAPTVHLPGVAGGFHVKSAYGRGAPRRALVKINGNFPGNPERFGLPTIQGVALLLDGERGGILAVLDSVALTALRTAAVSVVAARRLARPDARRLALVGCGVQAHAHLELLRRFFALESVALCDRDPRAAEALAAHAAGSGLAVGIMVGVGETARDAEIVVTSTPSSNPILFERDVADGAFVAAVGADNPDKCELDPALLGASRVVVDALASAAAGGDLRAALAAGALRAEDVHGELPALVAGRIPGRAAATERWIFDSTGLAATDLAAASLAYDRAGELAPRFDFAGRGTSLDAPAAEELA